ncbi:hypothetical protein OEG84_11450 [Hoeflea sp. G2-23]|uniref:N-acetyltransferase domain-containing protein n=1 Tax=Hoeflea algicola TaxID=2983763 RepID=A0ABT3Z9G9_9HYPH|nr:hypothetical protein [Hoeflea algicola]MCY0148308.1 hypothetical protein [Hoeflea algicola]
MLKIEAPAEADVRYVADRMRDDDVREFMSVSFAERKIDLVDDIVRRFGLHPGAIGFYLDDEPVGIGGLIEGRPHVGTLLFFATDKFASVALGIAKFTRQRLFPRYREAGMHRIEAISIDGHASAHRWIKMIGLKHEAALRGFGKGGETYHQFAWVADDVH